MDMEHITVSSLLLVPVVNVCESIKNWFQLVYQNLSWLQYCVLLPCVWLRNILRFPRRSNISFRKKLEKIRKSYAFSENDLKYEITLANNLLQKALKLPISLQQFLSFIAKVVVEGKQLGKVQHRTSYLKWRMLKLCLPLAPFLFFAVTRKTVLIKNAYIRFFEV